MLHMCIVVFLFFNFPFMVIILKHKILNDIMLFENLNKPIKICSKVNF